MKNLADLKRELVAIEWELRYCDEPDSSAAIKWLFKRERQLINAIKRAEKIEGAGQQ